MRLADLSRYRHADAPEELAYRARWDVASHFLRNIEELPRELEGDVAELCDMSVEAAEEAVLGPLTETGSRLPAVRNAVSSEAEMIRGWIERRADPVPGFVPLPPRRVLDHSEYASLFHAFEARFPGARASPIGGPLPWHADLREVSRALVARGVPEVYLLHPTDRALSTRSDPRLLEARPQDGAPHYYPPRVAYCTGPAFDFFVRVDADDEDRAGGWIEPMLHGR